MQKYISEEREREKKGITLYHYKHVKLNKQDNIKTRYTYRVRSDYIQAIYIQKKVFYQASRHYQIIKLIF